MHKSLIGLLAALALCVGCSSTSDSNKMTCDTAKQAYEAYQVLIASGAVDIDPQTIAYVKIAAAFLGMHCGWDAQQAALAKSNEWTPPVCDHNGVPIVTPP